jgi:hypothetical protein
MTATVMIGKKDYPLAPLVFDQMERAWPFLQRHSDAGSITEEAVAALSSDELAKREMQATRDAIAIIAIALESADLKDTPIFVETPKPPVDESQEAAYDELCRKATHHRAFLIRKTMLAGEIPKLRQSILDLLVDSGLAELGNVQAEVDQFLEGLRDLSSLTGTSAVSSASLSQQASKEAVGAG